MNKVLRCFIAPPRFLSGMDKAGIDLNLLEYPERMKNILSDIDLQKYNSVMCSGVVIKDNPSEVVTTDHENIDEIAVKPEPIASTFLDDIINFRWADHEHLDTINPLCNTDTSIFDNDEDNDVTVGSAPLLYKVANDGLLLVSLLQYNINNYESKKLYRTAWYNFYSTLLRANVPLKTLAKNTTFNYYINMTNG